MLGLVNVPGERLEQFAIRLYSSSQENLEQLNLARRPEIAIKLSISKFSYQQHPNTSLQ